RAAPLRQKLDHPCHRKHPRLRRPKTRPQGTRPHQQPVRNHLQITPRPLVKLLSLRRTHDRVEDSPRPHIQLAPRHRPRLRAKPLHQQLRLRPPLPQLLRRNRHHSLQPQIQLFIEGIHFASSHLTISLRIHHSCVLAEGVRPLHPSVEQLLHFRQRRWKKNAPLHHSFGSFRACLLLQSCIAASTGFSVLPKDVSEYSTRGGTSAYTSR